MPVLIRASHAPNGTYIFFSRSKQQQQRLCAYAARKAQHSTAQQGYQQLCDVIRAHAGYVHPALQLQDEGGIIATEVIPQTVKTVVELSLDLRLTPEVAQQLLLPVLNQAGLPTISLLEESQQLALAIAWLRQQGAQADEKWQAYISTMGKHNPSGWAKSPQQLADDHAAVLHQHGLDLSWWCYFVAQVQQHMLEQAKQLHSRFSAAMGLEVSDVLWALGQVQAKKVEVDGQVLLEPWSDQLRHLTATSTAGSPSSSGGSAESNGGGSSSGGSSTVGSSKCEIEWTYGLSRNGKSVVSKGTVRRTVITSKATDSGHGSSSTHSSAAGAGDQTSLLLSAGEELYASSSSSGGFDDLFSSCIAEQGHLAPLSWYLQHGVIPYGLTAVNMRTSDTLESWQRTLQSESSGASSSNSSGSDAAAANASSLNKPTVLWDYLTQQYQQDVLIVLAAAPSEHQLQLLQWVMKPVNTSTAPAGPATAAASDTASGGFALVQPDVDPLGMISTLDELLIAAIDAAE